MTIERKKINQHKLFLKMTCSLPYPTKTFKQLLKIFTELKKDVDKDKMIHGQNETINKEIFKHKNN